MARTLEQLVAAKEAELARLKERVKRNQNSRLILIGAVAEKVAATNGSFNAALIAAARESLSSKQLKKATLEDRYSNPVLPLHSHMRA